jgi:hypothetical protein
MRHDMQKVVGDTRRSGGHAKFPKHRRDGVRDVEDLPARESMSSRHVRDWSHSKGGKAFRSAPIRRWLNAQVGRPWSKVLSEMCARLNRETSAGRDALSTIEWYVETDVTIREDGVPMEKRAWNGKTPEVSGLYVHPVNGLLCRAEPRHVNWREAHREREAQELLEKRRQIGPGKFLIKHAENWFIVELATVPDVPVEKDRLGNPVRREEHVIVDALLKADVTSPYSYDCKHLSRDALYGSDSLYAKTAKQANHQELKRYGVI